MNTEKTNELISKYVSKPELETVVNDDTLIKMFNGLKTKRDQTRLNKYVDKYNKIFRQNFDKKNKLIEYYKKVLSTIELKYPECLRELFFDSIDTSMNYHLYMKAQYHALMAKNKQHFDYDKSYVNSYLYNKMIQTLTDHVLNDIEATYCVDCCEGLKDAILFLQKYTDSEIKFINSKTDLEWVDIIKDIRSYNKCRNYVHTNDKSKEEMFKLLVEKMEATTSNMEHVLGGYPDGVETDVNWGLKGVFNGIVYRHDDQKTIRASFKSFIAGGYNIQCRHIRVKVTLLK